MEIKLKRPLWNKQGGETMDVKDSIGEWAINKGYAEKIEKAEYQNKEEKATINNKAENVPAQNKQRGSRGRSSK